MTLDINALGQIDAVVGQWCLSKVPLHLKKEIDYDYEVDGQAVSIYEVRPSWRGQPGEKTRLHVAKFRFFKSSNSWKIFWFRQTRKWESYQPAPSAPNLEKCLAIIEADQYGCFFG